jgi:hypothetical protein
MVRWSHFPSCQELEAAAALLSRSASNYNAIKFCKCRKHANYLSNVLLISDAHRQLTFNDARRKKFKLFQQAKNENEQERCKVCRLMKNVDQEMSFSPKYKPITELSGLRCFFS